MAANLGFNRDRTKSSWRGWPSWRWCWRLGASAAQRHRQSAAAAAAQRRAGHACKPAAPPDVHEAVAVTAAEVIVAFIIAVPLGAAPGILIAENEYSARSSSRCCFYVFSIPKSIFLPMFILVFGIGFSRRLRTPPSPRLRRSDERHAGIESVRSDHIMVARSSAPTQTQILLGSMCPA
jgi:ABC-type dipeptide/oligopeptide/nickel transport system permease component